MTSLGTEGIVTEVRDYLAVNLGERLENVDARFDAALSLENVREWRIDDPVNGAIDKLPAGWVLAPSSTIDQWGNDYDYNTTDLVVWIIIRDQRAERLRQRVYRTALAVWETLKQGHFDGSITWQIVNQNPRMDYSEILTRGESLYSDLRIQFTVTTRSTLS